MGLAFHVHMTGYSFGTQSWHSHIHQPQITAAICFIF